MRSWIVKSMLLVGAASLGGSAADNVVGPVWPLVQNVPEEVVGSASHDVHVPPVVAPITDPFRAPEHAFGPGNRGIEYGTEAGQSVSASARGTVSFAGMVAGSYFVTVDHGGGLVTTVGFLNEILVRRGDVVAQGVALGAAGTKTHFSARQDGEYFDPALLFGNFITTVRLVPGPG